MTEHPHPHRARRVLRAARSRSRSSSRCPGRCSRPTPSSRAPPAQRHPQDLRELGPGGVVPGRAALHRGRRAARRRRRAHRPRERTAGGTQVGAAPPAYMVEGGLVPVVGPGPDRGARRRAPDQPRRDGVSPDVLVVHQQDLQAVMNALWAGGAEAMSLMDQRVISTSAFQCVGNVLSLHGRVYSPPYWCRPSVTPTGCARRSRRTRPCSCTCGPRRYVGLGLVGDGRDDAGAARLLRRHRAVGRHGPRRRRGPARASRQRRPSSDGDRVGARRRHPGHVREQRDPPRRAGDRQPRRGRDARLRRASACSASCSSRSASCSSRSCVWQLWWTDVEGNRAQAEIVRELPFEPVPTATPGARRARWSRPRGATSRR